MNIIEHAEDWHFLGYESTPGACWTLVGMTEADVEQCIAEFKEKGTVTMKIGYAQSSEVLKPVAVAKLKGDRIFFKPYNEEEEEA